MAVSRSRMRRWVMRQEWTGHLLWLRWCPRRDVYHFGPFGHIGRLFHD